MKIKNCKELRELINNKLLEQKVIVKNELRDELRKKLATKEDIALLKKDILLLKKDMTVGFIILFVAVVILNPTTVEFIKLFIK
jgi:hypothetical protein